MRDFTSVNRLGADPELLGNLFFRKQRALKYFIDASVIHWADTAIAKYPARHLLLEALAAATVYATQWDKKSPFVGSCMCGSGTVAIEAAMIATNRRPAYLGPITLYALAGV